MHDSEPIDVRPQPVILDTTSPALSLPHLLQRRGLRLFYGDLHNHTGYSDGLGRPEEALRQMRARGLHFAAITDHGELLERDTVVHDTHKWARTAQQVAALCSDEFLAWRGFEWSSPRQGHSNVWGSTTFTGYQATGDGSMQAFYDWLLQAQPTAGAQVLASFNHPGREVVCFDGCAYTPAVDDRLVALECFNRDDDYGDAYFQALDRGWHVGAIGVSDHHGDDWGSPLLPRAGVLAPALSLAHLQAALMARRVFATRAPTLTLLILGDAALMGSRVRLDTAQACTVAVWCHDSTARQGRARLELWSNGGKCVETCETRGLQQVRWQVAIKPRGVGEHWFAVRVLYDGITRAYSSPLWVRWSPEA
jgi:hypothetical protein